MNLLTFLYTSDLKIKWIEYKPQRNIDIKYKVLSGMWLINYSLSALICNKTTLNNTIKPYSKYPLSVINYIYITKTNSMNCFLWFWFSSIWTIMKFLLILCLRLAIWCIRFIWKPTVRTLIILYYKIYDILKKWQFRNYLGIMLHTMCVG